MKRKQLTRAGLERLLGGGFERGRDADTPSARVSPTWITLKAQGQGGRGGVVMAIRRADKARLEARTWRDLARALGVG